MLTILPQWFADAMSFIVTKPAEIQRIIIEQHRKNYDKERMGVSSPVSLNQYVFNRQAYAVPLLRTFPLPFSFSKFVIKLSHVRVK
jgi:hypothetical protein